MTVRLYGHYEHPRYCEVCDYGLVLASRCGPHGQGGGDPLWMASRLSVVIPCPQCTSAAELLALLPAEALSPVGGGDVA